MSRSIVAGKIGSLISRLKRMPDPGRVRIGLWVMAIAAIVWGADVVRRSPLNKEWLTQLEQVARILTPIAIGIGIYIAWRRAKAADSQAAAAASSAETGRFTSAIEQLGDSDKGLAVRLGGIYSLEKIAQDDPKRYHWTVMEVLCTYVREESSKRREPEEEVDIDEIVAVPSDIQAILTVLGRRNDSWERKEYPGGVVERHYLDLKGASLSGAYLNFANLGLVNLSRSNLRGAALYGAALCGARLCEANLEGATLNGADLTDANLYGAKLFGAGLADANFSRADLSHVDFGGANLSLANLSFANLSFANLQTAGLHRVNFKAANLNGANLRGADLVSAENLTRGQIHSADGDANTRLPSDLEPPPHWLEKRKN